MKIRATIFIGVLVLCLTCPAQAQDTSKQQERKAKLEKEIETINRQLNENAKKRKSALNDLALVRKKVSSRKELVKQSEERISSLDRSIGVKQHSIDSLSSRLTLMSAEYDNLVRNTYKMRDTRVWYMFILASRDFPQAARRYAYLKRVARMMNVSASRLKDVRNELNGQKKEMEGLKSEAQVVRNRRKTELVNLQKDEKQSAAVVNKLKKDKNIYEKQLAEKKRQVEKLNKEIQRLIAAAMKKKNSGGSGGTESGVSGGKRVSSALDDKLTGEFVANRGKLPWPVDGAVIETFGQHNHPVYKSVKMPFNNGVTLSVNPGSKVKAVYDGTVAQVVVMPGYNQCVLVQHGDYFTFYCKLKSVAVKSGQTVTTGQAIGTVDTISGETQMHFELWKGTSPQNPESWLQ